MAQDFFLPQLPCEGHSSETAMNPDHAPLEAQLIALKKAGRTLRWKAIPLDQRSLFGQIAQFHRLGDTRDFDGRGKKHRCPAGLPVLERAALVHGDGLAQT